MLPRGPKYPEKIAALKEKRARQAVEGAVAMRDYENKERAARDQLLKLRRERLAREQLKCVE